MSFLETLSINHFILYPCMILAMIFAKKKFAWLLFALGPGLELLSTMETYSMLMTAGYSNAVAHHLAPILLWSAIGAIVIAVRRRKMHKDDPGIPEGAPVWYCSSCGQKNLETVKVCQRCGVTRQWSDAQKKEAAPAQTPATEALPVQQPAAPPVQKPVEAPKTPAQPPLQQSPVTPPVRKPDIMQNLVQPPVQSPRRPVQQETPAVPPVRKRADIEELPATAPVARRSPDIEELPPTVPVDRKKPVNALLCMRTGPLAGNNYQCAPGHSVTLGRDASRCALALSQYPSVSAVHCRLDIGDHSVTVTDLNSSYGTFVNDNQLLPNRPVVARAGDTVRLASDACVFQIHFEK